MTNGLEKLAEGIGKTIGSAPSLYEDALQPTVREVGKMAARIPCAINAAFSGLDEWILNKENNLEKIKNLLPPNLKNVDPEKIVVPEPYVAVPAIQAISYSMDSDELRELYAKLLAKSMVTDTKDMVHPAYVETIKQLSPNDAKYFTHIFSLKYRPVVNVNLHIPYGYKILDQHINNFSEGYGNEFHFIVDNLCRLKLIDIKSRFAYSDDSVYASLLRQVELQYPFEKYKEQYPEALSIEYEKERIDLTPYGFKFYECCVAPI